MENRSQDVAGRRSGMPNTRNGEASSRADSLDRKQIAERFEQAWHSGTPPRLEDYLPPVGIPERQALLIDLVHIDLQRRLTAGETVRVESYLERYPELASDPE